MRILSLSLFYLLFLHLFSMRQEIPIKTGVRAVIATVHHALPFPCLLYTSQLKEDTFAYVQTMKNQGYKIYLLSNISIDSAAYLKAAMPFFKVADGAVLSYEIKVNKPDRKIFEALDVYKRQAIPFFVRKCRRFTFSLLKSQ